MKLNHKTDFVSKDTSKPNVSPVPVKTRLRAGKTSTTDHRQIQAGLISHISFISELFKKRDCDDMRNMTLGVLTASMMVAGIDRVTILSL